MRIERTAKTVIAGLMSVACLASVAACGPGSSSNKANTETEAVSTCVLASWRPLCERCFSAV